MSASRMKGKALNPRPRNSSPGFTRATHSTTPKSQTKLSFPDNVSGIRCVSSRRISSGLSFPYATVSNRK